MLRQMTTLLGLLAPVLVWTQTITCLPENPTAEDTVTITYDATGGNAALAGYDGEVYFHSGVITGTPFEPSGWRFVQGNWGEDDPRVRMQPIGSDRYQARFHIRSFYGLPESEPLLQMAFVFRDQSGTIVGKTSDEGDILYPDIPKYPNGPLELANGRDGSFMEEVIAHDVLPDGRLWLSDGDRSILVDVLPGDVARLTFLADGGQEAPASEALLPEYRNRRTMMAIRPNDEQYLIPLGDHQLQIDLAPLAIRLLRDGHAVLEPSDGFFYDAADTLVGEVSGIRLGMPEGSRWYGGGSRAIPMNRRGERFYLYNTANYGYTWGEASLNISIPYLLSSTGCGLLFDSYRRGYMDIGSSDPDVLEVGVKDTTLALWIIPGQDPIDITKRYTALTGRQPMPPRWALGYIQSRFGYKTQEETLDIVRRTLQAGYRLDATLIDLYWFGDKGDMGDFSWKADQWPDPEGMMRELDELGVNTVLISESYFIDTTQHWPELVEKKLVAQNPDGEPYVIPDFWAGPAGLLDVFKPQARNWFWTLYQQEVERGVDGWWCDSGEPENHPPLMQHSRGSAEEVHNLYSNYWSRLLKEGYEREYPDRRLFNLNRSGITGMQRYGVYPWSGDVTRSWDAFRAQLPIMMGIGICGVPYMHSDLGGFTGGPRDEELFLRWLQMGVFTPIMRVHGDALGYQPEPIFFSEETQAIARQAIQFRYALLPYNYTLAWKSHMTGLPLVRPMLMQFPDDEEATSAGEQYMWGDKILFAPVLEKGAGTKEVYLPQGGWYYPGYGDMQRSGWMEMPVDLEVIPFFIKAGSWLPLYTGLGHAGQWAGEEIAWQLYLADDRQPVIGELYYDDGMERMAPEKGQFVMMYPKATWKGNRLKLELEVETGSGSRAEALAQQMEVTSIMVMGLSGSPSQVKWKGEKYKASDLRQTDSEVFWNEDIKVLEFRATWRVGERIVLRF